MPAKCDQRILIVFLVFGFIVVLLPTARAEAPPSNLSENGTQFIKAYERQYLKVKRRFQDLSVSVKVIGYKGTEAKPDPYEYEYKHPCRNKFV